MKVNNSGVHVIKCIHAWDDNESDELGETTLIITAAKSATLAMGEFLAEGILEAKVLDGCEVTAETDPCGGSGGCKVWAVPAAEELAEACYKVALVPDPANSPWEFRSGSWYEYQSTPTVVPRIVIPWFIIWIVLKVPTSFIRSIHIPVFVKVFPAFHDVQSSYDHVCWKLSTSIDSLFRASILKVTKAITFPTLLSLRTRRSFLTRKSFTFSFYFLAFSFCLTFSFWPKSFLSFSFHCAYVHWCRAIATAVYS